MMLKAIPRLSNTLLAPNWRALSTRSILLVTSYSYYVTSIAKKNAFNNNHWQNWIVRSYIYSKDTVGYKTLSPFLRYFFAYLYLRRFSPLFSQVFYLLSDSLILTPSFIVKGYCVWIDWSNKHFPGMGPFSIFLNYFFMAETAFSPIFLLPSFAYIVLKMTFVATFMKNMVRPFILASSCRFFYGL